MARIIVAIDPAATSGEDADETGIIVAGKDTNGHGYVLSDQSGHYTPIEWTRMAVALYRQHSADRIVAGINNGGEMVVCTAVNGILASTMRMVASRCSYKAATGSARTILPREAAAAARS
jgi:phage terminase large subunit-like protein